MEGYYHENYNFFEIFEIGKQDTRIWNLYYDQTYDYIFVFIAKVSQRSGYISVSNA